MAFWWLNTEERLEIGIGLIRIHSTSMSYVFRSIFVDVRTFY
jgi:hypothetical protein